MVETGQILWNSLEVAKLLVGILTPVSVVAFGWFLDRRLKRIDHAQWANQKIIDKRLELYDVIAPGLNQLFCFFVWVGYWKEVSPGNAIETKRYLDKTVNIYRHLLGEKFYRLYEEYMDLLFITFTGIGDDAKIRSCIRGIDGDRTQDCHYAWNPAWDKAFADTNEIPPLGSIEQKYSELMGSFRETLGLDNGRGCP